ncbi:hypothetical protein Btru_025371, partial [Bulinus truncatus]
MPESKFICEIVPSYPASTYFQINSATCEVTLRNSVLLDSQTSYQVPIQVYDMNWPNNKVTRNLTVNVIRNENGPVFTGPSTANINTNFPPGETVLLLTASDADGDRLTFSKVNPNDNSSSNFIVDSTTGRIILIKPLTGPGTYAFDVLVTDNHNPAKTSTQPVRINVSSGTVSLPPSFVNAPYNATININAVPNSEVLANILATKQNLTGNLKYRIAGGVLGDAERFFRIDENNGRVSLTQRLDNSPTMNNRYSVVLFIEAYDDKVPSEAISTTLTIYFRCNLSPTVFTIEDYSPPGSSVITVGAADSDPLSPENLILFKLDPSRSPAYYFSINSYTGLITVSQRVSTDPAKHFTALPTQQVQRLCRTHIITYVYTGRHGEDPSCQVVSFLAEAQSACSSDATIIITFPENDSPTLPLNDSTYTQAIFTSGTEPFSVVIDFDPQDTTNQFKFPDYFTHQWNSVTNKYTVRMIKGINRDGNSSSTADDVNILQYIISCTETQGSPTVQYRIFKIQILDVNDNSPYFINAPYTVRVNELTPVGVTVFRGILADDLDEGPNKQITYILTPGISQYNFNGTQYFYLPSDQEGILSVFSPLDFESMYRQTGDISQTFYNITVIAKDNAVPASTQRSSLTTLRVIITDGDDQGPEFIYPSCIQSSQPNSKSCIRPKYLTSVYSGNSSEINLDLKPDPSDASNPTVYMLMQDRDTLNSTVTCTIRQTEPAGYESHFTTRSSLYSGKKYRCEIIKFANKIFNRANISSLEIVIEAVEQSANLRVDYATVVMSVDIFNLNPPIITYTSNIGYIFENSPVGSRVYSDSAANTTLMKLTFTDPDRSSSDPPSQFDISVSNGPFSVTQEGFVQLNNAVLDYETIKLYTFTVTIMKQAVPRYSASVSLTVNVLDLNDNYPIVLTPDSYIVSVPQGNYSTSPRLLVTVQATDVDFGPVVYSLSRVSPSNGTSKFAVSRPSGAVTLQNSVMAGEIYTVYVTVADQGNPVRSVETVVVVTVTPFNNQAPTFLSDHYTIYVSEGVPVSSSLFTLPVTDLDTLISSLTFTLTNESPPQTNSFFTLNGLNLNNLRTFDRESIPEHNITVTARVPEGNSAQTVITVKVLDINDNDPSFTSPSYTFTVAEGQPVGTPLGSATDSDQPNTPNSAVSYSIVPAVDSN